jgi:hypothetical protein
MKMWWLTTSLDQGSRAGGFGTKCLFGSNRKRWPGRGKCFPRECDGNHGSVAGSDDACDGLRAGLLSDVEIRPDVPVIISSGYAEDEVRTQFASSLAGVINKPYNMSALCNKIASVLTSSAGGKNAGGKSSSGTA